MPIYAVMLAMISIACPNLVYADSFKSSEFLTWNKDSQEFYFRTAIGMAGLIASQNDQHQARCILDWYFTKERTARDAILSAMQQYPDYHPRGVILAVLQKACGTFKYSK